MGRATATRTDAPPGHRPFGSRLAKAGLAVLIMVVIPSAVTWLIVGRVAVIGTLLGVVSGLLGALKSGTARAAHVVPASGMLAFIAFGLGIGWWWVALLGGVGAVAGALQWRGYLPAVAYAALLAIVVPEAVSLGDAAVIGIFAMAGSTLGVLLGRRPQQCSSVFSTATGFPSPSSASRRRRSPATTRAFVTVSGERRSGW